ncbi:hypothetical protein FHR71_003969 [Methylobacterium sp. RAS18]|nr:hypothetical protein [Methylobacterium sp. RAS18]
MTTRSVLTIASLCLTLGACSDEPSEGAMREAVTGLMSRLQRDHMAAAAFLTGGPRGGQVPPLPTFTTFRKVGCVPADPKPGHTCEFEVAFDGKPAAKDRARFYKAPNGSLEAGAAS